MRRDQYYKHEGYRIGLFVVVLFLLVNFLTQNSEYTQVYFGMALIVAIAEIVTLLVDYMFFWSKK